MTTKSHNLNMVGNILLSVALATTIGWWAAIPLAMAIYWRGE